MVIIQEFYNDQDVFVTGGTGFMGKVLLEKLLRSCKGLNKVYVLVRPKKGKDIQQRIDNITNLALFNRLKKECPENLQKIVPIAGDCLELGLGISENDRRILEENVSIVFHSAASVRFDDTLTFAAKMNTRGTREMMILAKSMKKLKSFVHVSTSYCNCDRLIVEEKMYPPHADWRKIIDIIENIDEHTLNILTPKILNNLPNTYVFTKSLAEHVVKDLGEDLPTTIYRPSVVVSTYDDPMPGWIDNFNGPAGLLVAGGKGILRVSYGDPNAVTDYVPVDYTVKGMIVAAWERRNYGVLPEPLVFNACAGNKKNVTLKKLIEMGMIISTRVSFENVLWKQYGIITNNKYRHYWRMIRTQLIPAIIVDSVIKLSGREPFLVRIQRRIYTSQIALHYFVNNTWTFKNEKILGLVEKVPESDKDDFSLPNIDNIDDLVFYEKGMIGAREYLMKEDPSSIPQSLKHRQRLVWLERIVFAATYIFLAWFAYRSEFLHNTIFNILSSVKSSFDLSPE